MSKERELLERWLDDTIFEPEELDSLMKETKELLAQPEQEPVGEDAVNKCLANAIKDGWYPVNEDSYRQGFWDAVESLEDGE